MAPEIVGASRDCVNVIDEGRCSREAKWIEAFSQQTHVGRSHSANAHVQVRWRLEPAHLAVTLPRRLVRHFGPVVGVLIGAMQKG
jgi:hypothetical protein